MTSTSKIDRTTKLQIYSEYGVQHLWYVDPILRTLEIFALRSAAYSVVATFTDEAAVSAAPFETHTFSLGALWQDDD